MLNEEDRTKKRLQYHLYFTVHGAWHIVNTVEWQINRRPCVRKRSQPRYHGLKLFEGVIKIKKVDSYEEGRLKKQIQGLKKQ